MTREMLELARLSGLQWNGGSELIGWRDGVVVRVDVRLDTVAAEIPALDFGEALTLDDLPALEEVRRVPGLVLGRGWLHARRSAEADVVAAANAIAAWWRAPLVALLEVHGLAPNADRSCFRGVVEGVEVEVAEELREDGRRHALVRAAHGCDLSADLLVVRPSARHPPTDVADVVLDGRISVTGHAPDLLARLASDAVRGVLLAVLYEHGGAIGPTHVQARVRTLREAAPALKDVVDLARLLGHR